MDEGFWPLSALQTVLLRAPRTSGSEAVKLCLKELVLAGTWQLDRTTERRLGRERIRLHLRPGSAAVSPRLPLDHLHRALQHAAPDGGELVDVVKRLVAKDRRLARRLRDDARDDLVRRGLLTAEDKRMFGLLSRTRHTVTASGVSWDRDARAREHALRSGMVPAALVQAGGLLLLLDADTQQLVDHQLRPALRGQGGGAGGGEGAGESDFDAGLLEHLLDLGNVDGLSGLSSAVDSAVDAGAGGGDASGGSGDGGGGGGD